MLTKTIASDVILLEPGLSIFVSLDVPFINGIPPGAIAQNERRLSLYIAL
jgi:hypothetical protein